ncbi:MAG: Rrf2 family transcriptional regulator [Rubrivivax sp.]|nr:Rrf2 family transcriptional regulator [Rubrivivax sp.]
MKLQKNTLLALYSVLEFAARPSEHVAAGEVAGKFGESAHHLAKVLSELVRAGIVESVRGVGGGYRFVANPKRLTLLDVIRLFESLGAEGGNGLAAVGSGTNDGANSGPHASASAVDRALGQVLEEIDQTAIATFGSITVDTMLKMVRTQGRPGS